MFENVIFAPRNMESINKTLKSLTVVNDNILEIAYNDNIHVELEDMEQLLKCVYDFTDGKPFKRLVIISPRATIDKEARRYLQTENHSKRKTIIAEAVIVHSLTHKMMFNIYAKFIKGLYPSHYFTDIDEAKKWLVQQG